MLQTKPEEKYHYNKKDLLESPERYSYTTFAGTDFISNYFDDRLLYIEQLENKYLNFLDENIKKIPMSFVIFKKLIKSHMHLFSDKLISINNLKFELVSNKSLLIKNHVKNSSNSLINTKKILLSLLLFTNENIDSYYWLSIFVRKFEVTKKIRSFYTQELKKAKNTNYQSLINYALLGTNLLIYFEKTKNYKMLNCALKLNDLLTSKINELKQFPDLLITLLSLQMERKIINELLREKSIKL